MNKEDRAGDLLVHYFRTLAMRCGVGWDTDMESEIRDAVRCIIDAAVMEAAEQNRPKFVFVCPECNGEGIRVTADGDSGECSNCGGLGKLEAQ